MADVDRVEMGLQARWAGHFFGLVLQVVGQCWMEDGGRLGRRWMQRQLITEISIAGVLRFLDDIRGALHYCQSALFLTAEINACFGTWPWLELIHRELLAMAADLDYHKQRIDHWDAVAVRLRSSNTRKTKQMGRQQ